MKKPSGHDFRFRRRESQRRRKISPYNGNWDAVSFEASHEPSPGQTIFNDLFTAFENANQWTALTKKQMRWCKAYRDIYDQTGRATPTDIARHLRISKAASCKMLWRLIKVFRPYFRQETNDAKDDELLFDILRNTEKRNLESSYVEKMRGKAGYTLWKPSEPTWHERVGFHFKTGRGSTPIAGINGSLNLPVKIATTHAPSVLMRWWCDKARNLAVKNKSTFTEALKHLNYSFWDKWPDDYPTEKRLCRFCRCLLPLEEIIEGRAVTTRRRYCSHRCKTQHHRIKERK